MLPPPLTLAAGLRVPSLSMSAQTSCLSSLLNCKESLQGAAFCSPRSKPSFRQEPITQPLRSKISPWKVLSVFIFAGNLNSLLSWGIYCCIDIFHCLRDLKWGENKVQMPWRQGIWHPWRKVQSSPILYPQNDRQQSLELALRETVIPKEAGSGTGGSCGIRSCQGWGQRPGHEKFAHGAGAL